MFVVLKSMSQILQHAPIIQD